MSNRPALLEDTASVPGFAHLDPMSQFFLGGTGATPATATGISDDSLYAIDAKNSGTGGLSFRATSGDGVRVFTVDNAGVRSSNGFTVTTGATLLGGTVTMSSGLVLSGNLSVGGTSSFTGAATFTAAATFLATVDVTGAATFRTTVSVFGNATFTANAILQQQLLSNIAVGTPPMTFTSSTMCPNLNAQYLGGHTVADSSGGVAVYDSNTRVVDSNKLGGVASGGFLQTSGGTITGTFVVNGLLTIHSAAVIDSDLRCNAQFDHWGGGSGAGFTQTSWGGYVTAKFSGASIQIPYR